MNTLIAILVASGSMVLGLCVYIFTALGMQTMANRRGVKGAWLAWVPVANLWLLGAISDQYQRHARGQKRARRITLLLTGIAIVLCAVLLIVFSLVMIGQVIDQVEYLLEFFEEEMSKFPFKEKGFNAFYNYMIDIFEAFAKELVDVHGDMLEVFVIFAGGLFGMVTVMVALAMVNTVVSYIALYDLYASCSPKLAVLLLIFSILLPVLVPVFVMVCRNRDKGMPQAFRSALAKPAPQPQPVYTAPVQPVYQAPVVEEAVHQEPAEPQADPE